MSTEIAVNEDCKALENVLKNKRFPAMKRFYAFLASRETSIYVVKYDQDADVPDLCYVDKMISRHRNKQFWMILYKAYTEAHTPHGLTNVFCTLCQFGLNLAREGYKFKDKTIKTTSGMYTCYLQPFEPEIKQYMKDLGYDRIEDEWKLKEERKLLSNFQREIWELVADCYLAILECQRAKALFALRTDNKEAWLVYYANCEPTEDKTDGGWECSTCELNNRIACPICHICNRLRDGSDPPYYLKFNLCRPCKLWYSDKEACSKCHQRAPVSSPLQFDSHCSTLSSSAASLIPKRNRPPSLQQDSSAGGGSSDGRKDGGPTPVVSGSRQQQETTANHGGNNAGPSSFPHGGRSTSPVAGAAGNAADRTRGGSQSTDSSNVAQQDSQLCGRSAEKQQREQRGGLQVSSVGGGNEGRTGHHVSTIPNLGNGSSNSAQEAREEERTEKLCRQCGQAHVLVSVGGSGCASELKSFISGLRGLHTFGGEKGDEEIVESFTSNMCQSCVDHLVAWVYEKNKDSVVEKALDMTIKLNEKGGRQCKICMINEAIKDLETCIDCIGFDVFSSQNKKSESQRGGHNTAHTTDNEMRTLTRTSQQGGDSRLLTEHQTRVDGSSVVGEQQQSRARASLTGERGVNTSSGKMSARDTSHQPQEAGQYHDDRQDATRSDTMFASERRQLADTGSDVDSEQEKKVTIRPTDEQSHKKLCRQCREQKVIVDDPDCQPIFTRLGKFLVYTRERFNFGECRTVHDLVADIGGQMCRNCVKELKSWIKPKGQTANVGEVLDFVFLLNARGGRQCRNCRVQETHNDFDLCITCNEEQARGAGSNANSDNRAKTTTAAAGTSGEQSPTTERPKNVCRQCKEEEVIADHSCHANIMTQLKTFILQMKRRFNFACDREVDDLVSDISTHMCKSCYDTLNGWIKLKEQTADIGKVLDFVFVLNARGGQQCEQCRLQEMDNANRLCTNCTNKVFVVPSDSSNRGYSGSENENRQDNAGSDGINNQNASMEHDQTAREFQRNSGESSTETNQPINRSRPPANVSDMSGPRQLNQSNDRSEEQNRSYHSLSVHGSNAPGKRVRNTSDNCVNNDVCKTMGDNSSVKPEVSAASVEPAGDDGQTWKCPGCGCPNSLKNMSCKVCHDAQPQGVQVSKVEPGNWTCKYCTLENPVKETVCSMCAKTRDVVNPAETATSPHEEWECVGCSTRNVNSRVWCSVCATSIYGVHHFDDGKGNKMWRCPHCQECYYQSDTVCRKCLKDGKRVCGKCGYQNLIGANSCTVCRYDVHKN